METFIVQNVILKRPAMQRETRMDVCAYRGLSYKIPPETLKMMSVARNIGKGSSMTALRDTVEKLRKLEDEKKSLLLEMEEVNKLAESKVIVLESEVSMLREELASSKTLLGVGDKMFEDPPAPRMEKPGRRKLKFKIVR